MALMKLVARNPSAGRPTNVAPVNEARSACGGYEFVPLRDTFKLPLADDRYVVAPHPSTYSGLIKADFSTDELGSKLSLPIVTTCAS